MTPAPPAGSLLVLFGVVFLSIAGTALIAPLLPLYAVAFGVDGVAVGVLLAVYPLMQLLCAPLWGRWSDRWGRRPILIISLAGATVSFALVGLADSFPLLVIARLIGGVFAANLAAAQAYAADVTAPEQRTRALGLLGAAFGLGFVVGPAIGGLLGQLNLSAPAYAAAALSLLNVGAALFFLPESRRTAPAARARPSLRLALRRRAVAAPIAIAALTMLGTSISHPLLPLYAKETVGFGPAETGLLFATMGAISALSQLLIVSRLSRRFREHVLVWLGVALLVVGALAMPPLTLGLAGLGIVLAMAVITIAEAIAAPATTALLSRAASPTEQGAILGVAQAAGAGARVVGPLLGAQVLAAFGPSALFIACAAVFGAALAVALPTRAAPAPSAAQGVRAH
ncbi:MAG: MFS transporter [Chloroflexota bacterium]|nr:MFS transporter [Dehalococcoidia bacterium]MDW8254007.1 MFS transporter [Chloroflexota bacterium]